MTLLLAALLLAGLPQEAMLADRKLGNGVASCAPQRVDMKGQVLLTLRRRKWDEKFTSNTKPADAVSILS